MVVYFWLFIGLVIDLGFVCVFVLVVFFIGIFVFVVLYFILIVMVFICVVDVVDFFMVKFEMI